MGIKTTSNVSSKNILIFCVLLTVIIHIECFRTEELKCDRKLCNNGDCYIKTNSITVGSEAEGYFMDCPYGYDMHNRRCWKVVIEKKTWQNAYIHPGTGWIPNLLDKGFSELAAGYIEKRLPGYHFWVWTRALIDSNNTWVSWDKPRSRYGNGRLPRFTFYSNYSCIGLGPPNYTYSDTIDCETELYSLHASHSIARPQTRNYTCRCHTQYSGESCDTIDSELRTQELTNPGALQCHNNTVIFVEFALYRYTVHDSTGMDCAAPNTLALLRYLCQGKNSCKLEPLIINTYIGQVCTNPNAKLSVRYSCVDPRDMSCHYPMSEINHEKSKTCRLTIPVDLSWNKSLDYCLNEGGQFAAFNSSIPSQFTRNWQPIPSFWIFDQLSDMRPDTRQPVECTMATVVSKTKPYNIHVVKDCFQRLPGICAIPPAYEATPKVVTTVRSTTSNAWSIPKNTISIILYNITDTTVDTTTNAMVDATTEAMVDTTTHAMLETSTDARVDTTTGTMVDNRTDITLETTNMTTVPYTADTILDSRSNTITDTTWYTSASTPWYVPMGNMVDRTADTLESTMTGTTVGTATTATLLKTAHKTGITKYSTPQTFPFQPPNNCSAQHRSGLIWPAAITGVTVMKPCPAGQQGYAAWTCEYNGEFNTKGPDYSNCTTTLSINVAALSNHLTNGTQPNVVVTELAAVLGATQTMAGGDIVNSIKLLDKAISAQQETLQSITNATEREKTMNNFTSGIVNTSGVLLGMQHLTAWYGLTERSRTKAAAKLISDVDSTAMLYASVLTKGTCVFFQHNKAIQLYVETRDPKDNSQLSLPNIIVPSEAITTAINKHQYSRFLPIIASMYNTIGQIMPIGDNFHKLTNVSQIIGASLNQTIQLEHDKLTVNIEKPSGVSQLNQSLCVFWNETDLSWSTNGCEMGVETNDTHFVCKCNHMTSFAVLMSFNPEQVNTMPLNVITIIGCSISIVCLAACIISFLLIRSLRNLNYKVHLHLCISLMIADIILIMAHYHRKDYAEADMYCTVLAMLLHYFYLATFMWMSLEGVQLYLAFVRVFPPKNERMYMYCLIGYGIPGVVVGICAGVNVQGYASTTEYCFLDTKSNMIWAFIAFVLITLIFNTGILFWSLRSAARLNNTSSMQQANSTKKWLWRWIILHPLLGVTWVFGFLQFGDQMVFSYVFTILNSLQGLFIFVFHVFRNAKVRHYFRNKCHSCDATNVETPRTPSAQVSTSSGQTEEYARQPFAAIRRPQPNMNDAMEKIQTSQMNVVLIRYSNLDENQLQPYIIPRARLGENDISCQRGNSNLKEN